VHLVLLLLPSWLQPLDSLPTLFSGWYFFSILSKNKKIAFLCMLLFLFSFVDFEIRVFSFVCCGVEPLFDIAISD
jgi:hypothetical protein